VLDKGDIRAWVADGPHADERYVAVFNLGDSAQEINLGWKEFGIVNSVTGVRDLWNHKSVPVTDALRATLRSHASALYKVEAAGSR